MQDDDDDLIDDEILEIFIEEAEEVSETITEHLPTFAVGAENHESLTELRRAYHTLKGSGRMVGASEIGETAWGIENMLNRVIDGSILLSQDVVDLVQYVSGIIPELVDCFRHRSAANYDLEAIQAHAEALAKGELVPNLSSVNFKSGAAQAEVSVPLETAQVDESGDGPDLALLEIFEAEVSGHIATVETFIREASSAEEDPQVDDALSRAMHTLKGSAKTASISSIAEVAVPVEKLVKEMRARQLAVDEEVIALLSQCLELIREGLALAKTEPDTQLPGTPAFLDKLASKQQDLFKEEVELSQLEGFGAQDPQLVSIFLTEGLDILLDAEKILDEWSSNPEPSESLNTLISEVSTLHRGASLAGLESIAELCDAIAKCYDQVDAHSGPSEAMLRDIKDAHEALINMMDQVAAGLSTTRDEALLMALRAYADGTTGELGLESEPESQELEDKLAELDEELGSVIPNYKDEPEAATTQSEGFELDDELIEIFLDEARDIHESVSKSLGQIQSGTDSAELLHELERDFHTLKGGARMAQLEPVAELAQALEALFDKLAHGQMTVNSRLVPILASAVAVLADQLTQLANKQSLSSPAEVLEQIQHYSDPVETENVVTEAAEASIESEEEIVEADAEIVIAEAPDSGEHSSEPEPVTISLADLDPELVEIFLEEARDIIDNSGNLLSQWEADTGNLELVGELQRELHTLKGGARMAELSVVGDIAHELETLFEHIVENRYGVEPGMISLCLRCHDALANMIEALAAGEALPSAGDLLAQIKQVVETGSSSGISVTEQEPAPVAFEEPESTVVPVEAEAEPEPVSETTSFDVSDSEELDADLLPMFLEESRDILSSVAEFLEQWRDDPSLEHPAVELQREMHTLKGGARLADIDAIADLAEAAENCMTRLVERGEGDKAHIIPLMHTCQEQCLSMLEALQSGRKVNEASELIVALEAGGALVASESDTRAEETVDDELDLEVLEIFVEEAKELSEALEEQTTRWAEQPGNDDCNRELQRVLHTLKGGARLSNLKVLADQSHELETQLVRALDQGTRFESDFQAEVMRRQEVIQQEIDLISSRLAGDPVVETTTETAEAKPAAEQAPQPQATKVSAAPESKASKLTPAKTKEAAKPAKADTAKSAPQETIRVSSTLMEGLVNLAGETSISRGRLETQISDFGFTLEEMSATIERLREQLRRMDMETEAQVLFRAEKEGFAATEYEDFDPLEMDRYSSIQQLSRSLGESATDLMELREALSDKARGAETLLLQQSRINSELQEGLMKTRMIPFSSMVPRLRRIARQISGELGKEVNFNVANAEGEMDRSVLERMIAPLEHMLRNALDHGIEGTEERVKAGKPKEGNVRLQLSREGGDVVLRMSDDGAGINDEKVFEKAVSQGLVSPDAQVSRHDILQFIMLPGFSTAEKVTQISGRGVGMDVVASEIKQMGGNIEINSTLGRGTEFTVRLPFTVSVNRALMVNTGDDFYAIPLNTIEGIVRVSPFELEEYYKPDAPLYEYAGRQYKLQYLGKLLHSSHQPKLQGQPLPLPVILVRGTDNPMALQVDSLMGSREIVVKSLGPQFSGVHAVSGATILGDGSVVVILDLPALIRDDSAGLLDSSDEQSTPVEKDNETPLVMVVDDSVTVRKVTTRLLERNGMEVVTAKDGVDAIAQLQDCLPDVMLLDIEMPRMDGFEVATLVRHDERLKKVPIIMITSRTGQKHRDRALSIGVNEYLGKPFQEQELLETIEKLVELKK